MLRTMFLAWGLIALCAGAAGQEKKASAAEDDLQVGTRWVGTYSKTWLVKGKKEFEGVDVEVKVTKRSGKDFTAEIWTNKRKSGIEVEGTIARNQVKFKATKGLTEDVGGSVVDNNNFTGRLEKGSWTGTITKPKTDPTYRGELKLKLKVE